MNFMIFPLRTKILVTLITLFVCFSTAAAYAQQGQIVVVDVQSLLKDSIAAKSIRNQVEIERTALEKEFSEIENKLRAQEKQLIADKPNMEPQAFNERRESFQKELLTAGRLVQQKKRGLEVAVAKATSQLRGEILKIVADLAEDRNYGLVLTRQNIVIVVKEIDITQDVMERLNANVKTVVLDVQEG